MCKLCKIEVKFDNPFFSKVVVFPGSHKKRDKDDDDLKPTTKKSSSKKKSPYQKKAKPKKKKQSLKVSEVKVATEDTNEYCPQCM
jgi:hypothetical protein